jgi:hypothetical protein
VKGWSDSRVWLNCGAGADVAGGARINGLSGVGVRAEAGQRLTFSFATSTLRSRHLFGLLHQLGLWKIYSP